MKKEKPPLLSIPEARAQGLWFVSKRYGYGWVPISWQGWTVTLAFLAILFAVIRITVAIEYPTLDDISFFLKVVLCSIILLFYICYKKGEKAYWRWGK